MNVNERRIRSEQIPLVAQRFFPAQVVTSPWNASASDLFTAIAQYLLAQQNGELYLGDIWRFASRRDVVPLIENIVSNDTSSDPLYAAYFTCFLQHSEKERAGVLSTLLIGIDEHNEFVPLVLSY